MVAYDAFDVLGSSRVYFWTGIAGSLLHLLTLLSYLFLPQLKKQHPAANLMIYHVYCNFMLTLGMVAQGFLQGEKGLKDDDCVVLSMYNQFFVLGSGLWYLMLSFDLLIALMNPWMGYAVKTWAYHTITWSISALSAGVIYSFHLYGLSSLNICWIHRTANVRETNEGYWVFLFGPLVFVWFVSFSVLLFATFRFARRQLDSTYRAKRRSLLQYFRYLVMYGLFWVVCGALYYSDYLQSFSGQVGHHVQMTLSIVFGLYPLLVLAVWSINTDLVEHIGGTSANYPPSELDNMTDHFSISLRKDLMTYTTVGIIRSLHELREKSPRLHRARSVYASFTDVNTIPLPHRSHSLSSFRSEDLDDGDNSGLYNEKKRLATTIRLNSSKLKVYYEKLGFTDYAPRIFENLRTLAGIESTAYETSFAGTLSEIASEGKSGMLFYFTSDRKYIVKTMTKDEHAFLMKILPAYHAYIRSQPTSLLVRYVGCHSMQLPVGWNKMFFVVMENVLCTDRIDERYDLKGTFAPALQPPLRVYIREPKATRLLSPPKLSSTQLLHDDEFVERGTFLNVTSDVRLELLTQMTSDCGFLQEMGIMDYSCILGIRAFNPQVDSVETLAKNAVISADQTQVYYVGFIDILQHYTVAWKLQHLVLSFVQDRRKITALPPPEYALRFLSFLHAHLLRSDSVASGPKPQRTSFNYGTL
ncbi:Phosphatidylinositol 4-phosphate 5-kinase (PIPK-D12/GPCR-PIPK) [Thraustotheca clavata]|uniref:Phosphatidylinositol 4-phosphate 5-kinase (PIPK-D12/GPCR-PIPK) n=1 Tax=Thraustotheca clavata TaxID=74557 RepID=A0A1V9ZD16_9STRA|nr:Phosphatidylinositol 4-phosphate 5-kinase (PIPK-D12/GPCR-PIPK) [Thraustotheca clavata]